MYTHTHTHVYKVVTGARSGFSTKLILWFWRQDPANLNDLTFRFLSKVLEANEASL